MTSRNFPTLGLALVLSSDARADDYAAGDQVRTGSGARLVFDRVCEWSRARVHQAGTEGGTGLRGMSAGY